MESLTLLATVTWINGDGGIWEDGKNWDVQRPPNDQDDVKIPLDVAVRVNTPNSIESLDSKARLYVDHNDLRVGASSQIHNLLTIAGGASFTSTGTTIDAVVFNNGLLAFNGIDNYLSKELQTTKDSTLLVSDVSATGSGGWLKCRGFTNHGEIALYSSAADQTDKLEFQSAPLINESDGIIRANGGGNGDRIIYGSLLDNRGTIETEAGRLTISAAVENRAKISLQVGNLTVNSGISNDGGSISIATGQILQCDGSFEYNGGSVSAGGTFVLPDVVNLAAGTSFQPSGTLRLRNTTINGPGQLRNAESSSLILDASQGGTIAALFLNDGDLKTNGKLTMSASFINTGTFALSGGDVTISGSTFTTNGTIDIGPGSTVTSYADTFNYNGGDMKGEGTLVWSSKINLAQEFSDANLGSLVVIVGSIDGKPLTNAPGKILTVGEGAIFSPFHNQGTVNVLSKLIVYAQPDPIGGSIVLAAGSFLVPAADLTFTAEISGHGGVYLAVPNTVVLGPAHGPGGPFANNSYDGPTIVTAGTLLVYTYQPNSPVTVLGNGRLDGGGIVGSIVASDGGTISLGTDPFLGGLDSVGDLTLNTDSIFAVRLNGTGYDQLGVRGSARLLLHAMLTVSLNPVFIPAEGLPVTILGGIGSLTGTFDGLPDGAILIAGGLNFRINYTSYHGVSYGVTLTYVANPPAPPPGSGGSDAFELMTRDPASFNLAPGERLWREWDGHRHCHCCGPLEPVELLCGW